MTRAPFVRRSSLFLGGLVVLLAALALTGCKPKVGGSCSGSKAACLDNDTGLFCYAGKWTEMSCGGPAGCAASGDAVSCDNSIAAVKDGCNEEGDVSCSTDHKAALECKNGAFTVGETCKGTHGCQVDGDKISCDNDISDEGDPCHFNGDYACTSDKSMVLKCTGNKMTNLNACRGPKACRVFELPQEHKVDFVCDDSVAQLNDPCDTDGEEACSMEKVSLFVCKSNKFTMAKACAGPKGCTWDEKTDHYTCDSGGATATADPGDGGAPPAATGKKKKGK